MIFERVLGKNAKFELRLDSSGTTSRVVAPWPYIVIQDRIQMNFEQYLKIMVMTEPQNGDFQSTFRMIFDVLSFFIYLTILVLFNVICGGFLDSKTVKVS